MKKILTIVLAVMLVMSFAATALAIHAEIPAETQAVIAKGSTQVTIGGFLRTRGWWFDNVLTTSFTDTATGGRFTSALPRRNKNFSFFDQRVKLLVDAKVSPNVQGLFELQGDQVWGIDGANQKGDSLRWIQAWIQYKGSGLFGFPAGLKIGHMPLALGEQQFFQHTTNGSDAVVLFMDPTKQLHVAGLLVKVSEGVQAFSRCTTGSASTTSIPAPFLCPTGQFSAGTSTVGGTTDNSDDVDAYVLLATYKVNDKNTVGINYTFVTNPSGYSGLAAGADVANNLKFHNVGLHAKGSVAAGFGYKAEVDIQFGKADFGDTERTKFKAYGIMLGANYNVNPVNIRAGFALGSGDSDPDDYTHKEFQTSLSDVEHYTIAYEYKVASAAMGQLFSGANNTNNGIANTTYYNLGVDLKPTKELGVSLDGYILRATKTPSGISKSVGWEVDAKLTYAIAKNLNYVFDIGYFKAGSFYSDAYSLTDKKTATVARQQLILSF